MYSSKTVGKAFFFWPDGDPQVQENADTFR